MNKRSIYTFQIIYIISLLIMNACNTPTYSIYSYSDGNGNTYIITAGDEPTIEYLPVLREMSSSGEYGGGDNVKKVITQEQFKMITTDIMNATHQKSAHIPNRLKGSGLIILRNQNEELKVILAPNAGEKYSVEQKLKSLIK